LNDKNLPEEVAKNLTDPSKELESIHEVLVFQVKYYKQIMKRLLVRVNKSEHECENYRRFNWYSECHLTFCFSPWHSELSWI
jgi:hypothetical protein